MSISLSGRTILIVEDEPLIALEIANCFERVGATVAVARSLAQARDFVERNGISAAIIDVGLGDGDAKELCDRLHQKQVPIVLHSGYTHAETVCAEAAAIIPKPASPQQLVDTVAHLAGSR